MSHLEDRLAEYVFEELSAAEMQDAVRHVAQCLECQGRVSDFRKVQHRLEQLPEADLPRRVVFVPGGPSPNTASGPRKWLAVAWAVSPGLAAAVVLVAALSGSLGVEWDASGFQVRFGAGSDRSQVESASATGSVDAAEAADSAGAIDYDAIDYDEIVSRLGADRDEWLDAAMARYDEENAARVANLVDRLAVLDQDNRREIRRVRAELSGLFNMQQVVLRESYDQNAALQLVAQRAGLE